MKNSDVANGAEKVVQVIVDTLENRHE